MRLAVVTFQALPAANASCILIDSWRDGCLVPTAVVPDQRQGVELCKPARGMPGSEYQVEAANLQRVLVLVPGQWPPWSDGALTVSQPLPSVE